MGRQGLGEARGGVGAMAGIDHGEASASVAVTHDNKAVSDEDESEDSQYVLVVIESLKTQLTEERNREKEKRFFYIKNRVKEHERKLSTITQKTSNSSKVWQRNTSKGTDVVSNLLTSRQDDALCSVHSLGVSPAEKDGVSSQEDSLNSTTVMLGGNLAAKNVIGPIKLPEVLKLLPSTTWTFLYRNQRMAEDQSVFGRRKIYNDADCGEALIYSDSEDEAVEDEEEKNEFKHSEDFIIRRKIEECGMSDAVLDTLAQYFDRAAGYIKARYEGCLIARNLLSGMKSCSDIFQYMNYMENSSASGVLGGVDSLVKGHLKGPELSIRSRVFRRRRRVRRMKHTSKSAGYHFIRKRIAESKDQLYKQYNPCGCQSACGKECPCLTNDKCCEKYCGCPKTCKNRFRGCHCAKSQCRSHQCPCFAADRECDPDVCRSYWVGCGDGSLGFPNQRCDNYECRNMKVLLKQQQRILLGRSDVCGWGAFLKNTVGKDEYLGEYTGELISHREAGMRGTLYDLENSSFLFNLNNEFVLDALRMGDKLKFANHSNDPNCYAKVMLVAGDHRVGIFAKERISAGEEIFYDYHYTPDEAPVWALKPDAPGAKDPGESSSARRKKLAH
ncbi:unnamed protein product [Alopecurus aequalis]